MQVVCEATQATECKVKVSALQCLVRIMSLYYQVILKDTNYFNNIIFFGVLEISYDNRFFIIIGTVL